MSSALSLKDLRKSYGETEVVAGLNLELAPGTCHGLLGPNGAGKTTTLRLALGLIEADAGSIELLGHRLPHEASQARMRVGVVPQADSLDPDFTVRENLLVFGRYFGLARREIEARLPALLDFAGLAGKADTRIDALSGGMKRRLALARALVNDPDVIFLDEPTTGLDPQARHLIWQGLRRLTAQGKTLLLTTHFMEEAERLCDRISIIDHGRLIAEGAPRELIAAHVEAHVVEIDGEDSENGCEHLAERYCRRCEKIGETLFCYTAEPQALIAALEGMPHLRYLHRPANLEDVFLKLTGRDLRD
ncbi:MAG: ATP-binding cassette domain-containing protein [Betaproteobacteria bacterium]|nr:ATP-binding cassette domain-containing protein [Betaproteobacteria bacterium]